MKNILIFGDSNTWGYDYTTYDPALDSGRRLPFDERWPGLVQLALGESYHVIEDALNARTVTWEDPYYPYRNGLPALKMALDANAPLDLVIIHIGCNEYKRYFHLDAKLIGYGIDAMVTAAKESYYGYPIPQVLLIAPPPVSEEILIGQFGCEYEPGVSEMSKGIADVYRAIAQKHDISFLDAGALGFSINTQDYLHYSKNDHKLLAQTVVPIIRKLI